MMIYPAVHYTMGGIWVDYELMTTVKGCYAIGECNFSDHGANRLGASALMQGLADGYFVLPNTISNYLADEIHTGAIPTNLPEFDEAEKAVKDKIAKLFAVKGSKSVDSFAKRLGHIMWEKVGMARDKKGLQEAIEEIRALRKEYWQDVFIPGKEDMLNPELEKAAAWPTLWNWPADGHGCAATRGIVRRSLPGGTPDRGRRGQTRRRELLLRVGMAVDRRYRQCSASQGASGVRGNQSSTTLVQIMVCRPF